MFIIAVRLPFKVDDENIRTTRLIIYFAVAAILFAGLVRYVVQPSFWLDEAFVAASLRNPSPRIIFAPLEYGQLFPRIYLSAIALVREVFGYQFWSLRLLPFTSFVIATILWGVLLAKRARAFIPVGVLAGALFIGSTLWLDQAIQLKQYTFDVLVALVPFLIADRYFNESLVEGKRKALLILLALPILLSYTYPLALAARVTGWYFGRGPLTSWRVKPSAVFIFVASIAVALAAIYATDHRFNLHDKESYLAYWHDCILRSTFEQSAGDVFRLLAKFLWGWHGRQPLVTAGIAPLQILGAYSAIKKAVGRAGVEDDSRWGTRTAGSLVLILGVILASAVFYYPICAGRVVLFTEVHTQILALEGARFILSCSTKRHVAIVSLLIFSGVVLFHSAREYVKFIQAEPAENLRVVLPLIKPEIANSIWVHSCSIAQVKALPDPISVEQIMFADDTPLPRRGQKTWILWTHLGADYCLKELETIRNQARTWQVIHEGPGRGLALAEF